MTKQAEYYWANRDKILAQKKSKYIATKKSSRIKLSDEELRLKRLTRQRERYKTHKDILNKGRYSYRKQLMLKNPSIKIAHNLRIRLRTALKGRNKLGSLIDLVSIPIEHLRTHLESKFTEGMSWDNYGKGGWHIDHIKPCSLFDLSIEEEQRKCFHYTNLQPLWEKDNVTKGKKYQLEVYGG